MKRRPGLTLLEVLVAIFIMGIGMLALFTLFPVGAMYMQQALKDDRCAYCAANAAAIANALNLRDDTNVIGNQGFGHPTFQNPNPNAGPSTAVYVDPFYFILGQNTLGNALPRVSPTHVGTFLPSATRWFSLLDELEFIDNATPDTGGGLLRRNVKYTWAYLLRRPRANSPSVVDMSVIVYSNRSTQVPSGEIPLQATGAAGTRQITINTGTFATPKITKGMWVMDITRPTNPGVANSFFYRVENVTANVANIVLDVNMELKATIQVVGGRPSLLLMENVAEVFDRGMGWQP